MTDSAFRGFYNLFGAFSRIPHSDRKNTNQVNAIFLKNVITKDGEVHYLV